MQYDRPPKGVRAVALFESSKGVLALLAGTGLLSLVHAGAQRSVDLLVTRLHLNPAHEYPRVFVAAAHALTDAQLLLIASGGLAYASVRFIEAYGLWFGRRWAEWFAALSGAIYIPFELYELADGLSWIGLGVLGINLLIVGYMSGVLYRSRRARRDARTVAAGTPG